MWYSLPTVQKSLALWDTSLIILAVMPLSTISNAGTGHLHFIQQTPPHQRKNGPKYPL